jgi:HEAT repeat protein
MGLTSSIIGGMSAGVGGGELQDDLAALVSGDEERREVAALALGCMGRDALDPLAELLSDPDGDLRWWAARSLAEVGGVGASSLLRPALLDEEADVRACVCLALGRIGAVEAAPELAARLADESEFVAAIAADALSMLGKSAVDALAQMLRHERPTVRLLAVRALGRTGSERAVEPLCGALEDTSYLVSQSALDALEKLGVGMVYFSP